MFLRGFLLAGLALPAQGFGKELVETPPWPTTPPASICGNTALLSGPSVAPGGAVTVPAGDNSGFNFNQPGATFWFAPGVHTLANDVFGQIVARANTTYLGAPGAIIDGQHLNLYAFTGDVPNVTIQYLTIRNFGRGLDNNNEGVVNHDSGAGWRIEYNTISGNDGAGVFLGTGNVVRYNCLKDNGQYGFSMFKPPVEGDSAIKNIVLDHNEITGNNTDDWESRIEGCGCTGGGKFWDVRGAQVSNNWVHDNRGTGLWADTNNIDFLFEGNFIESNDGEGIWYEISYNATIRNNTFRRNAWVSGTRNQGSPGPAIYLSESGGDARLASTVSGAAKIRVYDNSFEDNFSGVSIYENANRFCNSNGNTSKGYCTPFVTPTLLPETPRNYEYPNPISNTHPCYTLVASEPYKTDCRWHSKNIEVNDNEFRFDPTVVPCAGTYCGVQALYATGADNMPWSPYTVSGVQNDVMFNNGNVFHDNKYFGGWRFAKGFGETVSFSAWRAAPYSQEVGSTIEGDTGGPPPGPGPSSGNDLDADTATLEGSSGRWQDWYSTTVAQTSAEAHSGTHSLRVDVTAAWGWGVQLSNWPGFTTAPGVKTIGLWGKLGAGSGLAPKMTVKWLSAGNAVLQTHEVTLPVLTPTWQRVAAVVDAPAGASTVLVYLTGSGLAGDYFYLDDVVVGDAPNALDAGSAGGEGSAGQWQSWYNAGVSASTQAAYRGAGSLRVNVTDPWGWGVQLANWPGFATTAGNKRISYMAKQGAGAISTVTLRVKWFNGSQALVQTDLVTLNGLTTGWQQAAANVTAPSGASNVYLEAYSSSGGAGDSLYLDDIVITDVPN
ncbi:right-handed parallel beta-helix repeat-containing protein [Pyxidicoccus parkwayensis]|uniref:Right-handed parallel beta-helix repeat-containing protein n=1 Tax=Pyxidicoccus parkwayensis TaxID=2813578 RepID=A0ABX7NMK0_9BACT|nr:right-handed parallel beta-helix repeat-containing protein [Pyxidicoccus parkwaysis]QSQ19656.1 right-handed parallel beta-helix repeat-containing protein [Pyxidicoccus parkwaysis]